MYLETGPGRGTPSSWPRATSSWAWGLGPPLRMVRPNGMEDTPEYQIDVDLAKAGALSLDLAA